MLNNGLLYGSFNPLHLSHVDLMRQALESFQTLHVFMRRTPGVDLVDWDTKVSWLEQVNEQLDGRLRIYELKLQMKGKEYGKLDFAEWFLKCEQEIGERLDGQVCGGDMAYMAEELRRALPDRTFVVIERDERSSSRVRGDLDAMKGDLPDFVYRDLKERGF